MPAITSPSDSTVLITGANGFLATWTVGKLLDHGYNVRAAVRSEAKGEHLLKLYTAFGDRLSLYIVGDMDKPGVWDNAVKDTQGVIHTAARVNLNATNPKDIIDPAVGGTLGILQSIVKYGSSTKRFVYASSCAAITDPHFDTEITSSEVDWNNTSISEVETRGADASGLAKYQASKTLAEKALWEFLETNDTMFDATAINPPWIFGPPKQPVANPESLNDSNAFLYKAVVNADFAGMEPSSMPAHGWVGVSDVAEALVRSLSVPEAGGERIIVSAGSPWYWNEWIYAAHALCPPAEFVMSHPGLPKLSEKTKSDRKRLGIRFDNAKQERILGIKFMTMQELARDILDDYTSRGW
ncbi:hypothetical protein BP6252_05882 [Coleophoma cylindrospora]|uniref:NAD-dependent epimerase/dehydratase domain-containing protein n=1 Tax=Coleophoma cylindrospora TaxID=1849047 RepID=A0A3D8RUS8_9HELO|nr:hypothetical protein BP6252_05882 [Coleophoma cylindrospora]